MVYTGFVLCGLCGPEQKIGELGGLAHVRVLAVFPSLRVGYRATLTAAAHSANYSLGIFRLRHRIYKQLESKHRKTTNKVEKMR